MVWQSCKISGWAPDVREEPWKSRWIPVPYPQNREQACKDVCFFHANPSFMSQSAIVCPPAVQYEAIHETVPGKYRQKTLIFAFCTRIWYTLDKLPVENEKSAVLHAGQDLCFQWSPVFYGKPESSPLKNWAISCGEIPISDFRRTSILRKPLFIGDKIE